jgi:hypothetical protein
MGLAALLMEPQDSPANGTPGAGIVQGAGEEEVLLTANDFDQAKQMYSPVAQRIPG